MGKRLPGFIAIAVIFLLVIAFFYPLFYPEPKLIVTPDFGRSDAWHSSIAAKSILAQALHQRKLPLWEPTLGDGYPLFADGLVGALYLPTIFLFSLLPLVPAINILIVFSFIIGGLGMYVWLRLLGIYTLPAVFGGVTYMFSGIFITQIPHLMIIPTLSLIPWFFVGIQRIIQKPTLGSVGFLAFIIGQEILVGFPQSTVIGLSFTLFYFIWQLRNIADRTIRIIACMLSLGLGIGIGSIQLFPSWEFFKQTTAFEGFAPEIALYFSYPIKHLITFLSPFALGNPRDGTYPLFNEFDGSIFWENTGYIGLVPLFFIFISRVWNKDKATSLQSLTHWLFVVIVTGVLLMLGKHSPLYFLYSIPPLNMFRVPSRFLWMVVIALVMLASIGLHKLWTHASTRLRGVLVIILLIHFSQIISLWQSYHAIVAASDWLATPPIVSSLTNTSKIITIGSPVSYNAIFQSEGWQKNEPYYFLRNTLAPNSNAIWNIPSHDVYPGRPLRRLELINSLLAQELTIDTNAATISANGIKLLQVMGINRIITSLPLTQDKLILQTSRSDLHHAVTSYAIPNQCPRAYITTNLHIAKTITEAYKIFRDSKFIPCNQAIVENKLAIREHNSNVVVRVERDDGESLSLTVRDNPTASLLVVSDTFYPGWFATVDNQQTDIYPVNINYRGVIVPAGDHKLSFTYRPKSLLYGVYISIASLTIVVTLMGYPVVFSLVGTLKKGH